ncbi:MAG TPA: biotin carboxylase N-terminal domain-containing protein [Herbaspirillum sp.]
MFDKILIANRGEIACRVAATARTMGIATVAVYSAADAGARHVDACDAACAIGAAAAADSYLSGDKIIAAALQSGAQAIHPGYGFLSENAAFAQACADAGLVFIGPPPAAMQAMASKSAAKTLMAQAGVPLVPGYHDENQDPAVLRQAADRIGYPVLLKASAGGGGKGMRVVENAAGFGDALLACQREARASFGDDKILVEKYLQRARHIEIQLFADTHGNCIYLFERDCSVQRRHQKVLEEAPAPGLSEARRAAMGAAAVAAARAVGYVGAGTVEFIVEGDAFYFMEMNTRLQVEHPVTEMITGLDLVEWQLRVAAGQPLPLQQSQLRMRGHAVEARIYAENPERGFLPATGTLRYLRTPAATEFHGGASDAGGNAQGRLSAMTSAVAPAKSTAKSAAITRIDSGFRQGDTISPHYDPMIAKLIVWAEQRDVALAALATALNDFHVVGLATNIGFLQRLVACDAFAGADLDTGLIARNEAALFGPPPATPLTVLALAAIARIDSERQPDSDVDPWAAADGWRLHDRLQRSMAWLDETRTQTPGQGQEGRLSLRYGNAGWQIRRTQNGDGGIDHDRDSDADDAAGPQVRLLQRDGAELQLLLDDRRVAGSVMQDGDTTKIFCRDGHFTLRYVEPLAPSRASQGAAAGGLTAPMPGRIVALLVAPGDVVVQGTPLLVMEAMKMEHTIDAPGKGKIEQLLYAVGDQVDEGAPLLRLTAA